MLLYGELSVAFVTALVTEGTGMLMESMETGVVGEEPLYDELPVAFTAPLEAEDC